MPCVPSGFCDVTLTGPSPAGTWTLLRFSASVNVTLGDCWPEKYTLGVSLKSFPAMLTVLLGAPLDLESERTAGRGATAVPQPPGEALAVYSPPSQTWPGLTGSVAALL